MAITLRDPFKISARLLPSVEINGATLSLGYGRYTRDGRMQYDVWIDLPDGTEHQITDLRSGVGGGDLKQGFTSLLSFLGAAAESYQYRVFVKREDTPDPDSNEGLFDPAIVEWAYGCSDEISMLKIEIEESEDLIVEGGE
jgi:hypothetical protein